MKHEPNPEPSALRRLQFESIDSADRLHHLETRIMQRIDTPASQWRSLARRAPVLVLIVCLLGGMALGAGTVAVLRTLGFTILHADGQEYLSIDGNGPGERILLPVEDGEGVGLGAQLSTGGARLLTLDEEDAAASTEPRAPRTFRMEAPAAGSPAKDVLRFRRSDGTELQGVLREVPRN